MAQGIQKGLQSWRSGKGERQWLLRLIETMEQIARPETQRRPVDRLVLAKVRAQLGRPASYPYGAVGLRQVPARRQLRAAVEDADIIQTEKAALKDVASRNIFAVHPPREIEQQLLENAFQER